MDSLENWFEIDKGQSFFIFLMKKVNPFESIACETTHVFKERERIIWGDLIDETIGLQFTKMT